MVHSPRTTSTQEERQAISKSDLTCVVDRAAARRERIVPFAPQFWNPAPTARDLHSAFLCQLVSAPPVYAPGGSVLLVSQVTGPDSLTGSNAQRLGAGLTSPWSATSLAMNSWLSSSHPLASYARRTTTK